jgi:hypothetical protein
MNWLRLKQQGASVYDGDDILGSHNNSDVLNDG